MLIPSVRKTRSTQTCPPASDMLHGFRTSAEPANVTTGGWSIKRTLDITLSAGGLLLLIPVFLVCAVLIKLNSPGPIFFRQWRVGRGFQPFQILKFRTMFDRVGTGRPLTVRGDARITSVGHWLRESKLDELPQLINVLRGEMSLVGPRPEVPCFVQMFSADYEEILSVRPGITDFASLKYGDEAALLARMANPEEAYVKHVLPDKLDLAKQYVSQSSLLVDLGLIAQTLLLFCRHRRH